MLDLEASLIKDGYLTPKWIARMRARENAAELEMTARITKRRIAAENRSRAMLRYYSKRQLEQEISQWETDGGATLSVRYIRHATR